MAKENIGGYEDSFYDLADLLGLTAMPISPKEAWELHMRPRIVEMIRNNNAKSERY